MLDCTAEGRRAHFAKHGKPQAIYLSVFEPLTAPVIRCPEAGSPAAAAAPERLVVFHGAECAVWRHDNELRCHWDALTQARSVGWSPGDLRDGPCVSCCPDPC